MRRGWKVLGWSVLLFLKVSGFAQATEPLVVTLTFDDGPKGNVTEVAPVLEKFGWRGLFNIIVERVGTPGYLSWDEVRELKRRGHLIASHTLSHPHLPNLLREGKTNEVRRQIFESRDVFARELGAPPLFLGHPYVGSSPAVDAIIAEAGMKPMTTVRHMLGSRSRPGNRQSVVGKIVQEIDKGDEALPMDILFHGTSPTSGGWEPMTDPTFFERMLQELAGLERAGTVRVVAYPEYYAAFQSQEARVRALKAARHAAQAQKKKK